MTNRGWIAVVGAVMVAAGTTALVEAQKGGKPKPPSDLAAEATFSCPDGLACGISGDLWSHPVKMLTATNEMNITLDGSSQIGLHFQGQMGAANQVTDCPEGITGCMWTLGNEATFTSGFQMQSNTLDTLGETELEGGLLGIPLPNPPNNPVVYRARLNMTITVPGTEGFWRFDFNPNIPPDGGGILVRVVRNDVCTWTFSGVDGEKAALSILVKPPKGKQYAHREGLFSMPFVLTYTVPSLCGT